MPYAPGSTGECRSTALADERAASHDATRESAETSASIGRRELLKLSVAGVAAVGVTIAPARAAPVAIDLTIDDLVVTMIDGTRLNALGFGLAGAARVPGPVIRVREGSTVEVTIHNKRKETHGFEVTEISGSQLTIPAGTTAKVSFPVPHAGTYIYHDGQAGPLFRILGLHGVLVVEPSNGRTAKGSQTPYSSSDLTPAMVALFDAFGSGRFPGGKWLPAPSNAEFSNQEKIWVFADIDPKFNALLNPGSAFPTSSPLLRDIVGNFVPRYFTINGRSGFDASRGADIIPSNFVGEPTLIRNVNVGMCTHSPHIHGNDVLLLTTGLVDPTAPGFGQVRVAENIFSIDTWSIPPLLREDLLLPYEQPTDIPAAQFARMVAGQAQEPFPLRYVMHCHTEMSQTAAGGNYPQGLVTHWEIAGGLGGRAKAKGTLAAR